MEWVLFGVLSVVAAMVFNFVNPYIVGKTTDFASGSSLPYVRKTLVTAASFFVVLLVAGFLVGLLTKGADIPTAS